MIHFVKGMFKRFRGLVPPLRIVELTCTAVFVFSVIATSAAPGTVVLSEDESYELVASKSDLTNPKKRKLADKIVSTFENSTTTVQYCYVENLGDDRGIHAGSVGFTTGTGDILEVVRPYSVQKPQNPLAKYIPTLEKVNGTDSIAGLSGFGAAWKAVCKDPAFRKAQDAIVDKYYFNPAMAYAKKLNIKSAAGQLILYDTMLQHGEGTDPDGFPALVAKAQKEYPRSKHSEKKWLNHFLKVRKADLKHAHDKGTRKVWAESTDRVNTLKYFLYHNKTLKTTAKWEVYGDHFKVKSSQL